MSKRASDTQVVEAVQPPVHCVSKRRGFSCWPIAPKEEYMPSANGGQILRRVPNDGAKRIKFRDHHAMIDQELLDKWIEIQRPAFKSWLKQEFMPVDTLRALLESEDQDIADKAYQWLVDVETALKERNLPPLSRNKRFKVKVILPR